MRAVVQIVSSAEVRVEDSSCASIGRGFLVLCGIKAGDTHKEADLLAAKLSKLRVFPDEEGRLNRSLYDPHVSGDALLVSNFTLLADCKKSRRPDFFAAEKGAKAKELFDYFTASLRLSYTEICEKEGGTIPKVFTGVFGADMQISMCCEGPVTLLLDTDGD